MYLRRADGQKVILPGKPGGFRANSVTELQPDLLIRMKRPRSSDSGFDTIAPFYDSLSRLVFGNSLRRAQAHWLDLIPRHARILILGGGSGWLLSRVLAICTPQKVIYIDAAPAMIKLAQQKVKNDQRVDFRVGTETALEANEQVDAILTPFILDLFTNKRLEHNLFPILNQCLRKGGFWLCSDFVKPTRWWHRILLWSQYRFFRTISGIEARQLPNWEEVLNAHLTFGEKAYFFGGMVGSGYWQKTADDLKGAS